MSQSTRVVVTGAASGVGAATVDLLLDRGAEVLALDLHARRDGGRECRTDVVCDVSDRDQVAATIGAFAADGGLTGLVTSAAVYGRDVRIDDLRPDDVGRLLDVNVAGTLWAVQAAMPHLRESRGSVVCVASVAGRIGGVLAGAHYAASKGAIIAMVRSVAKNEIAHGVRVNGVAPGPVDTPLIADRGYDVGMFPIGRYADPEEIARPILFLLGDDASYATGVVLDVNGGIAFS